MSGKPGAGQRATALGIGWCAAVAVAPGTARRAVLRRTPSEFVRETAGLRADPQARGMSNPHQGLAARGWRRAPGSEIECERESAGVVPAVQGSHPRRIHLCCDTGQVEAGARQTIRNGWGRGCR